MSQFARPEADTANSNWGTDTGGAFGTWWEEINDVSPDGDTSRVRGPIDGSGNVYRFRLTDVEAPGSGTITLRVRCRTSSGSKTIDVELWEDDGTTSIQNFTGNSVPNTSYTNIDLTVTNSISDYTNLHVSLSGSTELTRVIVTQVYLELPDAAVTGPLARDHISVHTQAVNRSSLW